MSNISLKDLILQVKEKNLTKEQLEAYSDQLSSLFAEMMCECADLEKEEALFMEGEEGTVASKKVSWKATPSGQRLIVLKRYCLAVKELLNSLKSRVYRLIY